MMILNPEFQRNLWLEFSPFKLVAAPVMVLCMVLLVTDDTSGQDWYERLFSPLIAAYIGVIFLLGNYAAASSMPSESKGNSWDFQRMSSLGPWELTVGKLFGATSYAWYAGLILLVLIMGVHFMIGQLEEEASVYSGLRQSLYLGLVLVFSGIAGHAAALLISLYNMHHRKSSVIGAAIIGIFVSGSMLTHAIPLASLGDVGGAALPPVMWYQWSVPAKMFTLCSLLFFMVWIIMGAQRLMREELQYKNTPIMWVLFCVTTAIYLAGTSFNLLQGSIAEEKVFSARLFFSYVLLVGMTYLVMFSEAGNLAKYKRWILHLKDKAWGKSFEHMPAWCASMGLVLPLLVAANISGIYHGAPPVEIVTFSIALLLFAVRDGVVLHVVLLANDVKRARFTLIFYYLMVYGILPALCLLTYQSDLLGGAPAFYPTYGSDPVWALGPVMIQVVIALVFLKLRLQNLSLAIQKNA